MGERAAQRWMAAALGALAVVWLAVPYDGIPDLVPVVGYLDDLVVLAAAVVLARRPTGWRLARRRAIAAASVAVALLAVHTTATRIDPPAWAYDHLYRLGAPWDVDPVDDAYLSLLADDVSPRVAPRRRALDLGSGSGAHTILLAELGFDATGVDFSPVALAHAEHTLQAHPGELPVDFRFGDLTAPHLDTVDGDFDLLLDVGTLDDLSPPGRRAMAALVGSLAAPGALLVTCSNLLDDDERGAGLLGRMQRHGVSYMDSHEVERLFADDFVVRRSPNSTSTDCYVMERRALAEG